MKGKFLPPFYCLHFKLLIGQHLVQSVHTSFILVVQHCSWFLFYDVPLLMMMPQQIHLHGQWLGKKHHNVLPLDGFCLFAVLHISLFPSV